MTKIISTLKILFPAFIFLFSAMDSFAGKEEDPCAKTNKIIEFINTFHINPPAIDEAFNNQVKKTLLEQLDPAGYLLTKDDVDAIFAVCPSLPVADCKSHQNFIDRITTIYANRLTAIDSMVKSTFATPLDFTKSDSLHFDGLKNANYNKSESELYAFWEQYMRFQTLRYFITTFKQEDSTFEKTRENFEKYESEIREAVSKEEQCDMAHMLNMDGDLKNYILSTYLNAVTTSFDPHTNYFSLQEKEHFDHMLSRNKFSFGIDLDQNRNGNILIARLIPGGPAWRSGQLDEGDVLISIQFKNKELVDLTCSNLYEIENLMYQSEAGDARITVRNKFGQVTTVELKMEILEAAENVVYSFIMDGECKVGYITLPAFYTDPESDDPLGCASDLVKELVKLKNDHVEGIILDVRNNGGGSITEAVDLAGVFIDSGPLCLFTNKTEKPRLVNDINRGVIYDGPMLLIVNQMSASASEILAGILQDYHRAVIVGTTTYGKASGQNIFPVGNNNNGKSEVFKFDPNSHDFVKVTTARYFNLEGGCHQLVGIQPDVPLPAVFSYEGFLESGEETALPNITVEKEVNFTPFPELPIDTLKQLSQQRLQSDKQMNEIITIGSKVEKLYTQKSSFPLNFDSFISFYSEGLGEIRELDSTLVRPARAYTLLNNTFDADLLKYDDYKQKVHKEMISNINKNMYTEEGYKILCDLIRIRKSEIKE